VRGASAAELLVPAEMKQKPEEVRLAASEMLVPAIMHLRPEGGSGGWRCWCMQKCTLDLRRCVWQLKHRCLKKGFLVGVPGGWCLQHCT
jgi:hypothetical protein